MNGDASRRQTLRVLAALMLGSLGIYRASQTIEARNNNRRCNNCKHKCRNKCRIN
jgi:hypothetical protein